MIDDSEITAVTSVLKSGWLSSGYVGKELVVEISNYLKSNHIFLTNSCTSALHISLLYSGISTDDEVLVPSFTFASTANVVEHVKAKPFL